MKPWISPFSWAGWRSAFRHHLDEFKVGLFYEVPHVKGLWRRREGWWPVLGPKHDDRSVIGFDYPHYHVDLRFLPARDLGGDGELQLMAMPLVEGERFGNPELAPPVMRRRMCHRRLSAEAYAAALANEAEWFKALEATYADVRLVVQPGGAKGVPARAICPHRGADLSTLPLVNGCVTCPLHGLTWNVETGALVRRTRSPTGERPIEKPEAA